MIKSEPADDSASTRMWARVDTEKGSGFFDNMDDRDVIRPEHILKMFQNIPNSQLAFAWYHP